MSFQKKLKSFVIDRYSIKMCFFHPYILDNICLKDKLKVYNIFHPSTLIDTIPI